MCEIRADTDLSSGSISKIYLSEQQKTMNQFTELIVYGSLARKTQVIEGTHDVKSLAWSTEGFMTSHFEGNINTIQEKEIPA